LAGVLSSQTKLILALASTLSHGLEENPESLERFCSVENVAPPSPERAKKIFVLELGGMLSAQTTLMSPMTFMAICGLVAWPEPFDRFFGIEKVVPLSAERLKKTSKLPPQSFAQ